MKPLLEDDFGQPTDSINQESFGETLNEANAFTINAVKLAQIGIGFLGSHWTHLLLRTILVDQFYTIKFDESNSQFQDVCLEQISQWFSSLPAELQNVSINSSPWAMITNLLYQSVPHQTNISCVFLLKSPGNTDFCYTEAIPDSRTTLDQALRHSKYVRKCFIYWNSLSQIISYTQQPLACKLF